MNAKARCPRDLTSNCWCSRSRATTNRQYFDSLTSTDDVYIEDPGHESNGLYGGGCTGLMASFSFEFESYETSEGETLIVKVIRELPPQWLPRYQIASQGVSVLVSTRDGSARQMPEPGSDVNIGDFGAIKGEQLTFKEDDTEQTLQIIINNDGIAEYRTEEFQVYLTPVPGPVCENQQGRDCVYTSKLGHPHVTTIKILGTDDWFSASAQIVVISCNILLIILTTTLWLWSRGTRREAIAKFHKKVNPDAVDIDMINMMRDGGRTGASRSPAAGHRAARPNVRAASFAQPRGDSSPAVMRGNNARRKAVLAVEDVTEDSTPNEPLSVGSDHTTNRSKGTAAEGSSKKRTKSKKDSSAGSNGLDGAALAALASTSVSARRGARKGSIAPTGAPRLSERMRGGDDGAEVN